MPGTDYTPGDLPVPVGSIVEYHTDRCRATQWRIVDHSDPARHPSPPPAHLTMSLEEAYPDGVAYLLWPVGVPLKFGNRDQTVGWVRRERFRVVERRDDSDE